MIVVDGDRGKKRTSTTLRHSVFFWSRSLPHVERRSSMRLSLRLSGVSERFHD